MFVIECRCLDEVLDSVYEIRVLAGCQILPVVLLEME